MKTSAPTLRAYLADLRYFAFWCESAWHDDARSNSFLPEQLTTPLITRFRTHLQGELALKPASVNRALVGIKRFTAWAERQHRIQRDPARPVRFVRLAAPHPAA
ncbi:hypothetical protein [Deinococcus peraridilitoris]|uniref:hypothetical protein n=1 Tax=Deinococcus peraridilitoris TaxID=432329 RepID=UPI001FE0A0CB|nr:hypothetical protein [Deinococcus peraridilitoris]